MIKKIKCATTIKSNKNKPYFLPKNKEIQSYKRMCSDRDSNLTRKSYFSSRTKYIGEISNEIVQIFNISNYKLDYQSEINHTPHIQPPTRIICYNRAQGLQIQQHFQQTILIEYMDEILFSIIQTKNLDIEEIHYALVKKPSFKSKIIDLYDFLKNSKSI